MTGPVLVDPDTGEKVTVKLPIEDITIGLRHRTEFGDIRELADSIRAHGLLNPISVTADHRLIAGHRRLEAVKLLKVAEIPVRIIRSVDSAVEMLQVERDENVCRKPMNASELYALGKELEALERPAAAERQATKLASGQVARSNEPAPGTRDVVGAGLGMSPRTWGRLKHLGDKAAEGDESAASALAEVDAGKDTIGGAYVKATSTKERIAEAKAHNPSKKRAAQARELAENGATSRQIAEAIGISPESMSYFRKRHSIEVPADAVVGKTRTIDPDRVLEETALTLAGLVSAVGLIDPSKVSKESAEMWVDSLTQSLSALNRFRRDLTKEPTQ